MNVYIFSGEMNCIIMRLDLCLVAELQSRSLDVKMKYRYEYNEIHKITKIVKRNYVYIM